MNQHDCDEVFSLLSEYLDNELPPSNCAEMEAHLQDCPPCIDFVRSLRQSVQLCRKLSVSGALPPPTPEQLETLRNAYREMIGRKSSS